MEYYDCGFYCHKLQWIGWLGVCIKRVIKTPVYIYICKLLHKNSLEHSLIGDTKVYLFNILPIKT